MAKTKRKPPASPYASQVGAESVLRFGPEQSALQAALNDVVSQQGSEIASARSAAAGAVRTAQAAAPGVKAITSDVLGQIDQAIATQTPGTVSDLSRTRSRLAERMALATSDLATRQQTAAEGAQYAVNSANSRAGANRAKIFDRLAALGTEMGAYASGRAGELAADDLDRQTQIDIANAGNATSLAVGGVGADGSITPGGPKDPAANGKDAATRAKEEEQRAKTLASPDDHQAALAEIQRATKIAKTLIAQGKTRREAAEYLLGDHPGQSGQTVYEDVDDGRGGTTRRPQVDPATGAVVTTGARQDIPAVAKPIWASVALDMAYDGGVSADNVKRLHNPKKRYSVNELGLKTQHQRSAEQRAASKNATAVAIGVRQAGQAVGGLAG